MVEHSITDSELRTWIRRAVLDVEPEARLVLYGSRARKDAAPDSDWDLLVLLEGPCAPERANAIRRSLYEVEWETGVVLTVLVYARQDWETFPMVATPFHQNVCREGIQL